MEFQTTNIVISTETRPFKMESVREFFIVRYLNKRRSGFKIKFPDLNGTAMLYFSGKINILGLKDENEVFPLLIKLSYLFEHNNIPVPELWKLCKQNICGLIRTDVQIDLNLLAAFFDGNYEPEVHHTCLIRNNSITYRFHSTGSVIITGLKSKEDLEEVKLFIADCVQRAGCKND